MTQLCEWILNDVAGQRVGARNVRALTWQDVSLTRADRGCYPVQALAVDYTQRLARLRATCKGWKHNETLEEIARYGWWTMRGHMLGGCDTLRFHVDRLNYDPLVRYENASTRQVVHMESVASQSLSFMLRPGVILQAIDCTQVGGEVLWVLAICDRQSLYEGCEMYDDLYILGTSYTQALSVLGSGVLATCIHETPDEYSFPETDERVDVLLRCCRQLNDVFGTRWLRQATDFYDYRQHHGSFQLTRSDRCVLLTTPRQLRGGMACCDSLNRAEWYDVPYALYSQRHKKHISALMHNQIPDDGDYSTSFLHDGSQLGNQMFLHLGVYNLILVDEGYGHMYYFPLACLSHVREVLEKTDIKLLFPQSGYAERRLTMAAVGHNQSALLQVLTDWLKVNSEDLANY